MNTFERYEARLRSRDLADATLRNYLGCLRVFATWWEKTAGEVFDPGAVTVLDVAGFKNRLLGENRKPATVNLYLDALSSFFSWAASEGLCPSDPTEGVKRVPEQRRAPRWLLRKELGALIRTFQKYGAVKDRALLALLLHAGLRVSEVASLRAESVVIRERSGFVKVWGKGSKYREVPLNATARRMIAEWLEQHPGGEWLFPGKGGGHITSRAVQKRLKELGRLAGVEACAHKLRHCFCYLLLQSGVSLDKVAILAGHNSLNTTKIYTTPSLSDLEQAVEKLSWD
ncbi:MAG: integrase [Ammonifex sp.]|jgi:integrase/recombinase XerC|nr:MAG: integrase [Ammonifex sp.]